MSRNCLKLNSSKTEVLLFGPKPSFWSLSWWPSELGSLPTPVRVVKNLGVLVNNRLSFHNQAKAVASTAYCTLKMIKKVIPFIPDNLQKTVVTSLVLTKIDYRNGLYLIAHHVLNKLKTLQNAAARLLLKIPKYLSASTSIRTLHWLPVTQRILFKSLCIVYKVLHDQGPTFFKIFFFWYMPVRPLCSATA